MSGLTKSASERSTLSTESFESGDMDSESYSCAPHDLFYDDPESGDRLKVLSQGEPVPVLETKYKKKKEWNYGLKFRLACQISCAVFIFVVIFSISDRLDVIMLKRLDGKPVKTPISFNNIPTAAPKKHGIEISEDPPIIVAKKSKPPSCVISGDYFHY